MDDDYKKEKNNSRKYGFIYGILFVASLVLLPMIPNSLKFEIYFESLLIIIGCVSLIKKIMKKSGGVK